MRFQDIRQTVTKGIDTPDRDNAATPRRLSCYKPGGVKARHGVNSADIPRPQHNRRSRRAMGMVKPRRRIGGVALIHRPWEVTP